ncbi:MAG: hypothetical protein ACOYOV_00215 [Bacteroidales bacterium]
MFAILKIKNTNLTLSAIIWKKGILAAGVSQDVLDKCRLFKIAMIESKVLEALRKG